MGTLQTAFADFWKRPYNPDGSVSMWFLFIGLLLVLIFAWSRILKHIVE